MGNPKTHFSLAGKPACGAVTKRVRMVIRSVTCLTCIKTYQNYLPPVTTDRDQNTIL